MTTTLILLLLIITLLAGCTGKPTPLNVFTGREGVTVNFLKNVPNYDLYEESEVLVSVELWNKGAYSINESVYNYGYVGLDFDPLYFELKNEQFTLLGETRSEKFLAEGKSLGWPSGEKKIIDMGVLSIKEIPGTREMPKTTIEASVCYPYQTIFATNICLDADIYGAEDRPVCTNKGKLILGGGQGSPVAVSGITVDMVPRGIVQGGNVQGALTDEQGRLLGLGGGGETQQYLIQPNFNIEVENVGRGLVLSRNSSESIENICSLNLNKAREDINGVTISAKLDGVPLICTPSFLKLFKESAEARCYVPLEKVTPLSRNREAILSVTLDYVYRDQIQREVTIHRVG